MLFLFFIIMVTISCYYNHYNRAPFNFTFIKYEKYIKVILNDRAIIITVEELVLNYQLFQIYILSLLCTENTERICSIYGKNGIYTKWFWKNLYFSKYYAFTEFYKSGINNPFKSQEPKRMSSNKKIRKFYKLYDSFSYKIHDPIVFIEEYYLHESIELKANINKYIKYEMKIIILSGILHKYGKDIYSSIKNYL
jgi:hypothetical protein